MNGLLVLIHWLLDGILGLVLMLVIVSAIFNLLIYFDLLNRRNQLVNKIDDTFRRLTEPLYASVRRVIPPINGIDLSPLVVMFGIEFLRKALDILFFQAVVAL